ncbi:hypothetical protein V6N13_088699 [Hibiscus sabdariffa]
MDSFVAGRSTNGFLMLRVRFCGQIAHLDPWIGGIRVLAQHLRPGVQIADIDVVVLALLTWMVVGLVIVCVFNHF